MALANSVHLHSARVGPVHLGTSNRELAAHALENVADFFMHRFNLLLICSLSFVDGEDDVVTVSLGERDIRERLLDGEVHIARLKVVVIDLDSARHGAGLSVDEP